MGAWLARSVLDFRHEHITQSHLASPAGARHGLGLIYVRFLVQSVHSTGVRLEGMWLNDGPTIRPSTYLYLLGIALYSLASLMSLRMSAQRVCRQRIRRGDLDERPIALAIWRSSSVLPGAQSFAIVNFLTAFNQNQSEESSDVSADWCLPTDCSRHRARCGRIAFCFCCAQRPAKFGTRALSRNDGPPKSFGSGLCDSHYRCGNRHYFWPHCL